MKRDHAGISGGAVVKIFFVAAVFWAGAPSLSSQTLSFAGDGAASHRPPIASVCDDATQASAAGAALRLVCQNGTSAQGVPSPAQVMVIGFVGGFVSPDDLKHPEVLFASYLRERYSLQAKVFSNHNGKKAVRYATLHLDADHNGVLSEAEKKSARIVVYGHSWGASETEAFARELGRRGIPVLLTIQLDTITRFLEDPFRIPSNVVSAVNFYQSDGLLRGGSEIVASDTARTAILGNFRSTYDQKPINCDNYPWLVRTLNRPHHELENDPNVWYRIASLIDAVIVGHDLADIPVARTAIAVN